MHLKINYTTADAKRLLIGLVSFELILTAIYLGISFLDHNMAHGAALRIFGMNQEAAIPAWYSAMQLLAIGVLLIVISTHGQRKPYLPVRLLRLAGIIFAFLSADEGAAIHEEITHIAWRLGHYWMLFRGAHGGWISVYAVLALALFLLSIRGLRALWEGYRRQTLIALAGTALFGIGAVGIEILSYIFWPSQEPGINFALAVAAEEFLEMSGASLFLYSVLLLAPTAPRPAPVDQAGRRNDNTARDVELRHTEHAPKPS